MSHPFRPFRHVLGRRRKGDAAKRRKTYLLVEQVEERIAPAVFIVKTLADSDTGGLLSLRGAIADSINHTNTDSPVTGTGNDTIEFDPGLFNGTAQSITLTTVGDSSSGTSGLGIAGTGTTIKIAGPTSATTGQNLLTIAANATTMRAFYVASGDTLTLQNVGVSGGTGNTDGGGIYDDGGTVDLMYSTVSGNTATTKGGGLYLNGGALNAAYSTISGNTATSNNGGGLYNNGATVTLTNVTISGNTAHNTGGGIGGDHGTTNLINDTISNNTGVANGGGVCPISPTAVNVLNTIIAGNLSTNGADKEVDGTFVDQGHNLIGNTTGSTSFTQATDELNVSANLGALNDNGGPTDTMAETSTSPSIDHGADTTGSPNFLLYDQRGAGFPRKVNGAVDIGAYELGAPELEITNTAAPTPSVFAGNDLTYTITITNEGTADANTNSLSDALDANTTLVSVAVPQGWTETDSVAVGSTGTLTFTNATLAPGGSATFTIEVNVASNVASGTTLSNTATDGTQSTQTGSNPDSATATITVDTQADLGVTNDGSPDPVDAGNDLTYTVTVTNYGPSDAQTVSLSDAMDANTTLVAVTAPLPSGWTETDSVAVGSTGTLTFTNTTLAAGASVTFTIEIHVGSNVSSGTLLENTATVATDTAEPNPDTTHPDSATAENTVGTLADLGVSNSGSPDPVDAGNDLTYTVTVTNFGPSDAQSVTLSDPLPAGTTLVSTSPLPAGWTETDAVGPGNNGTLGFRIPTLVAGDSATFTIEVKVASNVADNTTLDDTATVATATAEPNPDTTHPDSATAENTVGTLADLGVSNSASPDPVVAGNELTYTVIVTNFGSSDAQNVTLSDPLVAGTTLVSVDVPAGWTETDSVPDGSNGTLGFGIPTLAGGDSATFTIEVKVASNVPNSTTLSNIATATTTTNDPSIATHGTSTWNAHVVAQADLAITETGPALEIAGDPAGFSYTITVANDGPSDNVGGFTVTDTLPSGLTFQSNGSTAGASVSGQTVTYTNTTGLVDGATETFTIHVTASTSIPDMTTIHNTATVASTGTTDPNGTNNTSSPVDTLIRAGADLSIAKSGPATAIAGDLNGFNYTLIVTNNGFLPNVGGFTVTDVLPAGLTFQASGSTAGAAVSGQTVSFTNTSGLAVNGTQTFVIHVTLPSSAPNGEVLHNSAVVTSNGTIDLNPNNDTSATVSTTVETSADLAVTNTLASGFPSGQTQTFSVVLTNNGPSDAQNVVLIDRLPANTVLVSELQSGGPPFHVASSSSGGLVTLTFTTPTLASGASATFSLVSTLASPEPDGFVLSDSATVTSATADLNPQNNQAVAKSLLSNETDMAITVSTSSIPNPLTPGGKLAYILTVTNKGPNVAQNVVVTDTLPSTGVLQAVAPTSGPNVSVSSPAIGSTGGTVTWSIGSLSAGQSATFTILEIPTGGAHSLTNAAKVSSTTTDSNLSNDAVTTVTQVASNSPSTVAQPRVMTASTPAPVPTVAQPRAMKAFDVVLAKSGSLVPHVLQQRHQIGHRRLARP